MESDIFGQLLCLPLRLRILVSMASLYSEHLQGTGCNGEPQWTIPLLCVWDVLCAQLTRGSHMLMV